MVNLKNCHMTFQEDKYKVVTWLPGGHGFDLRLEQNKKKIDLRSQADILNWVPVRRWRESEGGQYGIGHILQCVEWSIQIWMLAPNAFKSWAGSFK